MIDYCISKNTFLKKWSELLKFNSNFHIQKNVVAIY